jgi:hypothetical protein
MSAQYVRLYEIKQTIIDTTEDNFIEMFATDDDTTDEDLLQLNYLHFLCMIGDASRIKHFLKKCKEEDGIKPKVLLNANHLEYFLYGTPVHTLCAWNTDPNLIDLVISYGAKINIKDNYQNYTYESYKSSNKEYLNFFAEKPYNLSTFNNDDDSVSYHRFSDEFEKIKKYGKQLLRQQESDYNMNEKSKMKKHDNRDNMDKGAKHNKRKDLRPENLLS